MYTLCRLAWYEDFILANPIMFRWTDIHRCPRPYPRDAPKKWLTESVLGVIETCGRQTIEVHATKAKSRTDTTRAG